jgi:low affinity Fe/Cu permease
MAKRTSNHAAPKGERSFFCKVQNAFRIIANKSSSLLGTAWAFMVAVGIIVVWAATGHLFHYSDTWQLIINTGTTIVTFLMVFLIQNTQNRESRAIQLKLDELIRSMDGARNKLMDLEALTDEDLDDFEKEFRRLRNRSEQTAETVTRMSENAKSR